MEDYAFEFFKIVCYTIDIIHNMDWKRVIILRYDGFVAILFVVTPAAI